MNRAISRVIAVTLAGFITMPLTSKPVSAEVDPLAAALVVGGLIAADDRIDQWVRDHNGSGQSIAHAISDIGSPPVLYAATWYAKHTASSKQAKQYYSLALQAMSSAGIATYALKYATGRSRPDQEKNGDQHFGPSFSYDAFPSGHAATAFALAEVLGAKNPKKKKLYRGAAALIGLSRIYLESHHASDVVAGAAIGHYVGAFTLKHQRGPFEIRVHF